VRFDNVVSVLGPTRLAEANTLPFIMEKRAGHIRAEDDAALCAHRRAAESIAIRKACQEEAGGKHS
jgi:hypothetical protein